MGPADEGEERDRVGGGEGVGSEEEEGGVGVGTRHARRQRRREGYDAPVGPDGRETEEYLILLAFSPFILYFFFPTTTMNDYVEPCRPYMWAIPISFDIKMR